MEYVLQTKKYLGKFSTIASHSRWLSSNFCSALFKKPIKLYQKNNFIIAKKNKRATSVNKRYVYKPLQNRKKVGTNSDEKKSNKKRYSKINEEGTVMREKAENIC